MYNSSGLVVGQNSHSNRKPVCDDDKRNWFGRFDKSWDSKSGSSNQLKPWLNPNGTSNVWISSMSGDEPCKASYYFESANDLHTSSNVNGIFPSGPLPGTRNYNGVYMASGTIETGQNITIQNGTSVEFHGETTILGSGFIAEAGSNFRISSQPCLRGCNTGVGRMASSYLDNNFIVLNTDNANPKDEEEMPQAMAIAQNIHIYPNPNEGIFEIAFLDSISDHLKIFIFDALGKLVYEQSNVSQNKVTIDISSFRKGIYLVQIIQNENAYTRKIIVE